MEVIIALNPLIEDIIIEFAENRYNIFSNIMTNSIPFLSLEITYGFLTVSEKNKPLKTLQNEKSNDVIFCNHDDDGSTYFQPFIRTDEYGKQKSSFFNKCR
jgi:hypothetical protein